jgi:purine-binding chemotaxis protein CheW
VTDTRSDHYILFLVNETTYALPSRDVAHIEMIEQVTTVPNAASFIDGVVFSRGQVVPAVNMRARFGFARVPLDLRTRLVVVQVHGRRVALLVDSCREFLTIPADQVHPPGDALAATGDASCVLGIATIANRVIVLLNLDQLLSSAEPLTAASA